ncbi:phage antirepressor KilAC domain-containing protein [Microbulbifer sp. MLAF003]|uniref:phage antirepressor KilAC domain-containing protein n=1 Tax=unclassified Microbulbifer TaxID=2619833 RepID=UPI0024ACE1D3|nr:phage antirepressor KilAC domain-containing protein [Microbulbifer sp. MLAF003]WHI52956.1 phage antirepressor KilAC domain-containing protein [Microbulbifer sp. MLAF003]
MKKEKLFTITQAARTLEMGRNSLLKLLRNNGLLHSREPMRNSPTKFAATQGLLVAENAEFERGPVKVPYIITKVTSRGMVWIRDLIEDKSASKAS